MHFKKDLNALENCDIDIKYSLFVVIGLNRLNTFQFFYSINLFSNNSKNNYLKYFLILHILIVGTQQPTWLALVGDQKVLGGERAGVLPKHWTEDGDVTGPPILTL